MGWHNKSADEVLKELGTNGRQGLSDAEAGERLEKNGPNSLLEKKGKGVVRRFFDQLNDFLIIILIAAAAVSLLVSALEGHPEYTDPVIIMLIVFLNAILGVSQESKAQKALEALKELSAPSAKVRRGGEMKILPAAELVEGDIILLEAGDFVPADARIIEAVNLKAEEGALTGESVPVLKTEAALEGEDTPLGDRTNMLFSSSAISYGRGVGVVTETGMGTEVGRIAGMIMEHKDEETPLQKKLAQVGKILGAAALLICAAIFGLGLWRGILPFEMFMTSVGLAVAAIPEGLPAIVTIVLAIGVGRMAKQNAIVRKLPAVETLGSAGVICSDKTGTLTQNRMTVTKIYTYGAKDEFALALSALCNDSVLARGEGGELIARGDPTEAALVVAAAKAGEVKESLEAEFPRCAELPFDSGRKLMTTVHKREGGFRIITKGAPDILLERCADLEDRREEIYAENEKMARGALRVLAVAYRDVSALPGEMTSESLENGLVFAGLIGMIDPPRPEAKAAVALCRKAKIRPVMITGDHRDTAVAIALELGIMEEGSLAISGSELEKLSDEDLAANVHKYSVYARVSPEHKVRIVRAWRQRGVIVAMTGDGVNDAPALKAADIGCAMGITGTDVAKGAADIVLTDDNFATIVSAVKEGRGITDNIKKSIHFLLSSNVGEILTIFTATLIGTKVFPTVVLYAIQLLWVNLVTDGLPALALGVEPVEDNIMERPPSDPQKSLFSGGLTLDIIWQGAMIGALTLSAYLIGVWGYKNQAAGNTMAFAVLSMSQLFHAFNVRGKRSLFKIGILSNPKMVGAFAISMLLQLIVVTVPSIAGVFRCVPLVSGEWLAVFGLSFLPVPIVEAVKLMRRGRHG